MIEAEAFVEGLCSIGADKDLVIPSPAASFWFRRGRFGVLISPFSSGGVEPLGVSAYWHFRRRSLQDKHGSPGISI